MATKLASMALFLVVIFTIQEPRIITCTINTDMTVSCPEPIPTIDESWVREWELVAPLQGNSVNSDTPLLHVPLVAGQQVKVQMGEKPSAIATCEVRVWYRLKDYTSHHPGERVPGTLRTLDDDCQPWYGKL